jgi:hypothetical protein
MGKRKREGFCPRCTANGVDPTTVEFHSRRSATCCPSHKRRLARRHEGRTQKVVDLPGDPSIANYQPTTCALNGRYVTRTVKIGFNSFVAPDCDEVIRPVLEEWIAAMTGIRFEGTRLANLFAIYHFENELALPEVTQDLLNKIFNATCGQPRNLHLPKTTSDLAVNHVRDACYAPYRPSEKPWYDAEYMSQVINLAAKGYRANCENHVTMNLQTRLTQYIRYEFQRDLHFLRNGHCKALAERIISGRDGVPQFKKLTSRQFLLTEIRARHIRTSVRGLLEGLSLEEEEVKANWYSYLKVLWRLLQHAEGNALPSHPPAAERKKKRHGKKHRKSRRQKVRERRKAGERHPRPPPTFTILPITSYSRGYISLDTDALHSLLRKIGMSGVDSEKEVFRDQQCDDYWRACFEIHKVVSYDDRVPRKSGQRRFAYSISTDGVGVSVSIRRPVSPAQTEPRTNAYGFREDGSFEKMAIEEGVRVIGIDPNRKKMAQCAYGPRRGEHFGLTRAQWHHLAGYQSALAIRERWLKERKDILQFLSNIPTAACSRTDDFARHLAYVLANDEPFAFYGERRWRKFRWAGHIARERAWHTVVRHITKDDPRTIVAFGDGNFGPGCRGHFPTPRKELIRRLRAACRLRMVDEFRKCSRISRNDARNAGACWQKSSTTSRSARTDPV